MLSDSLLSHARHTRVMQESVHIVASPGRMVGGMRRHVVSGAKKKSLNWHKVVQSHLSDSGKMQRARRPSSQGMMMMFCVSACIPIAILQQQDRYDSTAAIFTVVFIFVPAYTRVEHAHSERRKLLPCWLVLLSTL